MKNKERHKQIALGEKTEQFTSLEVLTSHAFINNRNQSQEIAIKRVVVFAKACEHSENTTEELTSTPINILTTESAMRKYFHLRKHRHLKRDKLTQILFNRRPCGVEALY